MSSSQFLSEGLSWRTGSLIEQQGKGTMEHGGSCAHHAMGITAVGSNLPHLQLQAVELQAAPVHSTAGTARSIRTISIAALPRRSLNSDLGMAARSRPKASRKAGRAARARAAVAAPPATDTATPHPPPWRHGVTSTSYPSCCSVRRRLYAGARIASARTAAAAAPAGVAAPICMHARASPGGHLVLCEAVTQACRTHRRRSCAVIDTMVAIGGCHAAGHRAAHVA